MLLLLLSFVLPAALLLVQSSKLHKRRSCTASWMGNIFCANALVEVFSVRFFRSNGLSRMLVRMSWSVCKQASRNATLWLDLIAFTNVGASSMLGMREVNSYYSVVLVDGVAFVNEDKSHYVLAWTSLALRVSCRLPFVFEFVTLLDLLRSAEDDGLTCANRAAASSRAFCAAALN